jgi:hypothetical protein
MESRVWKSLNGLKILQTLIQQMEQKQEENPEYIVRNIELIDRIIDIMQDFRNDLMERLPKG